MRATPYERLKRDPLERAFSRGYQYGVTSPTHHTPGSLPFTLPSVRPAWINGWREGLGDNWDGMTGTAGIHRLNENHAVADMDIPRFTRHAPPGRLAEAQGPLHGALFVARLPLWQWRR
ncbi:hypothetical protein GTA07_29810 [Rhodococcus hoagii]|nr:hypothetical protein [Prescottella equi]